MSFNGSDEITSAPTRGSPDAGFRGPARAIALVATVACAAGSVGLMFRASQHPPRLLLVLFTIWVLSPFVALFWANIVSKRWSAVNRVTLYCTTFIVTLGSLAIYGRLIDVKPAGSPNAFLWVIVPPSAGVFAAIVVSIALLISCWRSRRSGGA